ncbi:hypothetical protein MLD38_035338 [Melastoma candidum]|uniref:Uncharacterized protein n=2 Tax=Melastoma candidum TaxID=119954 RepID=A0ACB9LI37_9MYRT|nr:hypothetical protein MLD38_035337 [Melastoma candidum]KAI4310355.1 hypothetical protein MLD38_035338 [Melastoma candidum]
MAEKTQQEYHPRESNGYQRNDREAQWSIDEDERRRKRIKWAIYIAAFTVFQVMVLLVFGLVIMKVKAPKFRVGDLQIQTLTTNQAAPSFDMSFIAPIRIKNPNFGPYKFDQTTVDFTYGGVVVGQVIVPKSKANFKSTKKINAEVTLNSNALSGTNSGLGSELTNGVITLGSKGTMNGKVTLMLMFKKKRSTQMDCTMVIDVVSKAIKSVECK